MKKRGIIHVLCVCLLAGILATLSITMVSAATTSSPSIVTSSLPDGNVNTPYSQSITATGGSNIFTSWSIISGSLPDGLDIVPPNGTPTTPGSFTFTVQVYDNTSTTATQSLTIVIDDALIESPLITTPSLPDGMVYVPYFWTLEAANGSGTYVAWAITSGDLPAGLSLNPDTGSISGTPTSAGLFSFIAQVTDSNGATGNRPLEIFIATKPPPPLTTPD